MRNATLPFLISLQVIQSGGSSSSSSSSGLSNTVCIDITNNDTCLERGTTAGFMRLYSTTNLTNNTFAIKNGAGPEFGSIGWSGNIFYLGTQSGLNGGTARDIILAAEATAPNGIYFAAGGASRWQIATSGLLRPFTDNTLAIGDSSHRVSNVYAALTNATGLPISTGVSGLGTGVATFLATPSSANLASAITNETGTGALVFGTSPTFTTGITIGAYTLPGTDGTSNQVLQTNGSGAVSWATVGGAASAPLTGTGATITTDTPLINVSQTWNSSAVRFTALKANITDTLSTTGSANLLMDLQIGGTEVFGVNKFGNLVIGGDWNGGTAGSLWGTAELVIFGRSAGDVDVYLYAGTTGTHIVANDSKMLVFANGDGEFVRHTYAKINHPAAQIQSWASSSGSDTAADTGIVRNAAGVVEINNGTACSTASNCRDLKLRHLIGGGTVPTVANTSANSCGTSAASITGSDSAGKITVGATSGTSCTITFGTAFTNAPSCWATDESTLMGTKAISTTTTLIVSATAFTAGDVIAYGCVGY